MKVNYLKFILLVFQPQIVQTGMYIVLDRLLKVQLTLRQLFTIKYRKKEIDLRLLYFLF